MVRAQKQIRPGYKLTEVGIIPEDWEFNELKEYSSFISYGFTNPMPTTASGVFMITAADISNGKLQLKTARCTTEEAYDNLLTAKSKPKRHDILLTKDGSLGRLSLVNDEKICINQSVALIRPNKKITPIFLKRLLESPIYQKIMIDNAGGSTIKHIYITIVDKMRLGVPQNISEQSAIAQVLSDTDNLIASLDALIEKKRAIKQGAMQELLTGRRRLPGFNAEWEILKLKDCCVLEAGRTKSAYIEEGGKYLVVDMGSVSTDGQLIASKPTNFEGDFLKHGDLVMPKDDIGGGGIIGRVAFIDKNNTYVLGDHVFKIHITHGDPRFYSYLINDRPVNNSLKKKVSGSAQLGLSRKSIEDQEVAVPIDIAEQIAIAQVLSDMDAEIQSLEARRDKYKSIKQGMMSELLTGNIRLLGA